MRPLLWVSKSQAKLAEALRAMGHQICANTVRKLLHQLGYSRQVNRKADEGSHHDDRDAQFEHINTEVLACPAPRANRSSPSTPRRRSWSAAIRTVAATIARAASPGG
jgi:hypothetical protein